MKESPPLGGLPPVILVSNDDGYQARGLSVLADALGSVGEVWVVAPERERSAVGHAISLHKPVRVSRYEERRFWCSGTPTDAVYVGICHLCPRPPALVLSGINHGANLGDDVTYSGTVAAAMEGCLMEIPSIAVSLVHNDVEALAAAGRLAARLASQTIRHGLPHGTMLNLNVPPGWTEEKGVRVTRLGKRRYGRAVAEQRDPRGRPYYWIGGAEIGFDDVPGTDCNAVRDGIASLTPLHLDLTHDRFLHHLRGWELPPAPPEEGKHEPE